jgi:hypothetical protein
VGVEEEEEEEDEEEKGKVRTTGWFGVYIA